MHLMTALLMSHFFWDIKLRRLINSDGRLERYILLFS